MLRAGFSKIGALCWRALNNVYNNSWELWHLQFANQYCKHYEIYSFQSPGDTFIIIAIYKRGNGWNLSSWCLILRGGFYIFSKYKSRFLTSVLRRTSKTKAKKQKRETFLFRSIIVLQIKIKLSLWSRGHCLVWPSWVFLTSSLTRPFLFLLPGLLSVHPDSPLTNLPLFISFK